ncbi:MAG: tetratricopeptide repeat protein, partial [Methanosarcinaceae archaeon]|nr:tetratricopeptide repeat protein [Methanosarcinaceae archaeon]
MSLRDKEKQAAKRYTKAAELGDAAAQYNLGRCYAKGEGVEKDPDKAAYWFMKAAEQGDVTAQKTLGVCY